MLENRTRPMFSCITTTFRYGGVDIPIPKWELEYIINSVGLELDKTEYNAPDEEIMIMKVVNPNGGDN